MSRIYRREGCGCRVRLVTLGGLIISVTFLLPTDILWEHKPRRDRDIIDN